MPRPPSIRRPMATRVRRQARTTPARGGARDRLTPGEGLLSRAAPALPLPVADPARVRAAPGDPASRSVQPTLRAPAPVQPAREAVEARNDRVSADRGRTTDFAEAPPTEEETVARAAMAITGAIVQGAADLLATPTGEANGDLIEATPDERATSTENAASSDTQTPAQVSGTSSAEVDALTVEGDGAAAPAAEVPEAAPAVEGEGGAGAPEPAPELSPAQAVAPAVQAVSRRATAAASHQPESAAAGAAMASSNDPAVTRRRGVSAAGAAMADDAETGEVNRQSFREQLREAIRNAMPAPQSESEARRLMDEGGEEAAEEIQGHLGGHTSEAMGGLPAALEDENQPDPASIDGGEEVELTPEEAGPPPAPVSAGPVVPLPSTSAAVDMSSNSANVDQLAAENNITESQLARGNDPQFDAALGARDEAERHNEEGPARLREAEALDRANTRERAQGRISSGLTGFQNERATQLANVATVQSTTSGLSATRKAEITVELEGIGQRTREAVTTILAEMNEWVGTRFQGAVDDALRDYDDAFDDVRGGFLTRVGDFFTGGGDERFEAALRAGRRAFEARIDRAIDEIATHVEIELARARERVAQGRTEIDAYINETLPQNERDFATDASAAVTEDFEALEGEISSSRDALVSNMVDIYRQGIQRRDAREEELRLANRSLWERVYDATVGVVQKVLEFKNMLLGILARAAAVVEAIIQDPIQFLSNLIAGIKAGLEKFMGNIVENLKQALMGWLFGALEGAGLTLPDKFDLKGFLSIVLQVLGLTKENVRARAVRILGEETVSRIETAVEILRVLFTEGPAGLWRMLLEKLGDIKEVILAEIRSWVITKIIEAGIKWILGLLNPAGAFVKACMMIYDIVVFFIERGQQIISAVNAIINALGVIVAGNIGAMANAVEGALNRILPVVISFLASLLGLGGISEKIRNFIDAVQRPVNKAIDWVINKGVALARRIRGLFGGGQQNEADEEPDDPEKEAAVQAALLALDQAEARQTDEGGVTREEAEELANRVRAEHPVISGIRVEQHGERWRYFYRASAERTHDGSNQAVTEITDEWFRENRTEIFQRIHTLAAARYRGANRPQQAAFVEGMSGLPPGQIAELDVGGHPRRARGFGGAGNVLVGERRGETSVSGHTYGELGSRLSEDEVPSQEVAEGIAAAMRGEPIENPEIADAAAIVMGAETARSRGQRAGGGMSEVTTRLAVAGLASGELSVDETFGTRDANAAFSQARRERREIAAESRRRFQAGEITAQEARSSRAGASRAMRAARRETGGLLPETMVGFAGARRAGRRLVDPSRRDPGGQTAVDADEIINRTVELVYRLVKDRRDRYESVDEVMEEIENVLNEVDDSFSG